MKQEKKHPLEDTVWGILPITNYRGCFVTKLPSGLYSLWGRYEVESEEIDRIIDETCKMLNESIKELS